MQELFLYDIAMLQDELPGKNMCERMIITGTLCMQEYTLLACVLQSKDKEIY